MEKECKCPTCHKTDMVYPSGVISDYVCVRCCCLFDEDTESDDNDVD